MCKFIYSTVKIQRIDGAHYIKKGADVYVDAYSAFSDNCGIKQSVFLAAINCIKN